MTETGSTIPLAGYEHAGYAASLSEFGSVLHLPRSGGWTLRRPIEGSAESDLIGPYPLFFCSDWRGLPQDLADAADTAVSFSMVTDPFADLDFESLKSGFDVAVPFKKHFIADLSRPVESFASKSHQETARRAAKKIEVSLSRDPRALLGDWIALFRNLVRRHKITGIRAFSERAFAQQLAIPGLVAFEAREIATGELVGLDLWYLQRDVAYGHLAAFSDRGYALSASYATKWCVLNYFSGKARYLNLGGAAGASADPSADGGLAQFKRGWSSDTRTNYFFGRILDPPAYARLVHDKKAEAVSFFPAYRKGEF